MTDTFGIPLAFVIIAALTLWVVIGCRGLWWLKMFVVAVSIFFSICLWQNLADLQGWPTVVQPPQKFEIKWVDIKEPNKKTGDPGGIYVWLKDINPEAVINESYYLRFHHKELEEEPRIHKMPYSRPAHEQAQGIKGRIAQGKRVFAQMGKQGMGEICDSDCDGKKCNGKCDGKGKPGQGKPGSQLASQGKGGSLSQEQDWIFHELPPPLFQEKITEQPEIASSPPTTIPPPSIAANKTEMSAAAATVPQNGGDPLSDVPPWRGPIETLEP